MNKEVFKHFKMMHGIDMSAGITSFYLGSNA